MAETPYPTLGSEDILSAHLNGVQYSIGNIEEALDLNTVSKEGYSLQPLTDMQEESLHYRIYEARDRGWLESPAPVIYRNGSEVDTDEYEVQPAYGVVVFPLSQDPNDVITADFTHVTGDSQTLNDLITASERIDGMETGIDTLESDITSNSNSIDTITSDLSGLENEVGEIDTRVGNLESGDSGGGGSVSLPSSFGVGPFYTSGSYVSHQLRNYTPYIKQDNNELDTKTHIPEFGILVNGGTIDAFPMPITNKLTFDRAGIMLGSGNGYAVRVRIGVYADDNGRPGALIKGTSDITVDPGEWGYASIDLTLEPGMYWIARQDKSSSQWNGLNKNTAESIQVFDGELFQQNISEPNEYITTYGGYRAVDIPWTDGGVMPDTYPSSGELFERGSYGTPWLVVK